MVNALSLWNLLALQEDFFRQEFLAKWGVESRNPSRKLRIAVPCLWNDSWSSPVRCQHQYKWNIRLAIWHWSFIPARGQYFYCWSYSLAILYSWLWDKEAEVTMLICFRRRCPSAAHTCSVVYKWAFPVNIKERSKMFLINWSTLWLVLAFYNIVPKQMRDEVTGPAIVPRNFLSVARILT